MSKPSKPLGPESSIMDENRGNGFNREIALRVLQRVAHGRDPVDEDRLLWLMEQSRSAVADSLQPALPKPPFASKAEADDKST
jgi:hypothetical protein